MTASCQVTVPSATHPNRGSTETMLGETVGEAVGADVVGEVLGKAVG